MEKLSATLRTYFDLGLNFYNRGEFLKAAEQWKLAINEEPGFADAHKYLALAYERLGWKHKAKKQWLEYLKVERDAEARNRVQQRLSRL